MFDEKWFNRLKELVVAKEGDGDWIRQAKAEGFTDKEVAEFKESVERTMATPGGKTKERSTSAL